MGNVNFKKLQSVKVNGESVDIGRYGDRKGLYTENGRRIINKSSPPYDSVEAFDTYGLTPIESVIKDLKNLKKKYESMGGFNITFGFAWSYDSAQQTVEYKMIEPEHAYEKRVLSEQRAKERRANSKAKKEREEREEYERLKAKFEVS